MRRDAAGAHALALARHGAAGRVALRLHRLGRRSRPQRQPHGGDGPAAPRAAAPGPMAAFFFVALAVMAASFITVMAFMAFGAEMFSK